MSVSGKNTISFLWNKVLTLYNKLSSRITTLENSTGGGTGAYYCTCSTSGTTLAKVATCEDTSFTLKKGVEINVYFTYTNSSTSTITLNVNSTGAIRVMFTNGSSSGYYKIISASVCKFIYDGTYWRLVGGSVRADSDSTSSGSFSSSSKNYVTERDVYYGTPTINGSKSYSSNTTIYAPTSTGASGYILQSSGSGAPTWVSPNNISTGDVIFEGMLSSPTTLWNLKTHNTGSSGVAFYIVLRIIGVSDPAYNKYNKGFIKEVCIFYYNEACGGLDSTITIYDPYNSSSFVELSVIPNVCAGNGVPQLNINFTGSTISIVRIECL